MEIKLLYSLQICHQPYRLIYHLILFYQLKDLESLYVYCYLCLDLGQIMTSLNYLEIT